MSIKDHIVEHEILGVTNKINRAVSTVESIGLPREYDIGEYTNVQNFQPYGGIQSATSTFSGWGGAIGSPQDFDTICFRLISRETVDPITQIRLLIAKNNADGQILCESFIDVNVAPGENQLITGYLGMVIENIADDQLYFAYQTTKLVTHAYSTLPAGYADDDTTYGRLTYTTSSQPLTRALNIWSHPAIGTRCQFAWVKKREIIVIPELNSNMIKYNDLAHYSDPEWLTTFERVNKEERELVLANCTYIGDMNTTSIFSGYGGAMKSPQNFSSVDFQIKNRATSGTITQIDVYITEFNKDGEILFNANLATNIAAGERATVTWDLGEVYPNINNKKLYFVCQCNQYIDTPIGYLDYAADDSVYGWLTYTTGKTFKAPTAMTKSFSATVNCPVVRTYRYPTMWAPTQDFIDRLGEVVATSPDAIDIPYDNDTSNLAAENVQAAIDELETMTGAGYVIPTINLPDRMTAVVGDTLQLFYRGIIESISPYNYEYEVYCTKGYAYPRYFEYTPVIGDVGTVTFYFKIIDRATNVSSTKLMYIDVVDAASPTVPVNIMCVGDSLTYGGAWAEEAYRRLTQSGGTPTGLGLSNITFVGDRSLPNYPTQKLVGNSGWSIRTYLGLTTKAQWLTVTGHNKTSADQHSLWTDSNGNRWLLESIEPNELKFIASGHSVAIPAATSTMTWYYGGTHHETVTYTVVTEEAATPFWDRTNNVFGFTDFFTNNSITHLEEVYILLGWNGRSGYQDESTDFEDEIANWRTFLDQLHTDSEDTKVKIMGIQVPGPVGGWGCGTYGATSAYGNYFKLLVSACGLNRAYQELANESAYSSWVTFVGVQQQFDSENGYPTSTKALSTRCSTTENIANNGVHPGAIGYLHIGDAAYRSMVKAVKSY